MRQLIRFVMHAVSERAYCLYLLECLIGCNRSEVGTMFCLSWLITWYGHVLSDFKHIVRLYDFFMACHPLMPIYLAADVRYIFQIYIFVFSSFTSCNFSLVEISVCLINLLFILKS